MKAQRRVAGVMLALVLWGQAAAAGLTDGLLLHYTFDVDEGVVVTDGSGSGRFGWIHGAAWASDGVRGGVLRFENSRQYLVADDAGLPAGDSPRTMALWVKLDALGSHPLTTLLTYGRETWNQMSGLGMDWRVGRAHAYFTQCGGVALSQWRMTEPGQWHHLAYVYEGEGRHRFYVDGAGTDGMSELRGRLDTQLSGAVVLGAYPTGDGPNGGAVDDVRIYSRALAPAEIAALAEQDQPPPATGPVLHYTFDRDEGGIVTDDSGNGRMAIVNGATWVADGARGGAYRFDSNQQTILATDAGLPNGDSPRTLAMWMKIDRDYPGGVTGMFSYGTPQYNQQSGLGYDWRLDRDRYMFSQSGACFLSDRQVVPPGTWAHVAYTYAGNGRHHLFVNGQPSDGMSELWGPVNTTLSGLVRMGGHPNGEGPDGGYLDDVRVYNRVLSPTEIAELARVDEATSDLILHYAFDPQEGLVARDSSGHGNDGQLVDAQVAPGFVGNGLRFDGSRGYIQTPSSDSLMPDEITLATWVKLDGALAQPGTLIFKRNQGYNDNESYCLELRPSGAARLVLGNGAWQRTLDSQATLGSGRWHHVAATFSQPTMKVYVDGQLSATGSYDMPLQHNPNTDLLIGVRDHLAHSMDSFADCTMDDVRIYGRVLSPAEIAELAELFMSESDPPVPGGEFELRGVETVSKSAGEVTLKWTGTAGKTYTILWATNLTEGFQVLADGWVATASECAFTHALDGLEKAYFAVQENP